jgi:predicted hotdog family 3-hydroxylacyl-ACP dehydratase
MRLVDKILEVDADHAVTLSRVAPHWPGMGPRGVAGEVLIELMAQTAGVHNGWERLRSEGRESDKRGWLVGVKSARLEPTLLPLGSELETRAENQFAFEGFREITAKVTWDGRVLAEAVLQLLRAQ